MRQFNWVGAALFVFLAGCSGSGERADEAPAGSSDEHLIRQYLEQARGFSYEEVVFKDDRVLIDRDVVAMKADLLDEIAEVGFVDGPTQEEQGYYYTPVPHLAAHQTGPLTAANGHFSFSAAVPETWRNSFRAAFAQWSSASATDCVNFTEGTGGPAQILIGVGNAGTADNGQPAGALSSFPRVAAGIYRPGQSITIGTIVVGSTSSSYRLSTALHEIGHTLGFTHPWKGEGSPIPGTSLNTNGCCTNASYNTVMDYVTHTALGADDLNSLSKVFAKVGIRPSCG